MYLISILVRIFLMPVFRITLDHAILPINFNCIFLISKFSTCITATTELQFLDKRHYCFPSDFKDMIRSNFPQSFTPIKQGKNL
jgi:hypothetical protein